MMMPFVLRPVMMADLAALLDLASSCGVGVTTLPHDKNHLGMQIERSLTSFARQVTAPHDEKYILVLEDIKSRRVVGVCGIEANVGWDVPFYSYKIITESVLCQLLDCKQDRQILHLVNDYHGSSEVCSLVLHPDFRRLGIGPLLSRGRFMLMAEDKHRFQEKVFAEMRGACHENDDSPFWQAVGQLFFPIGFLEASYLSSVTNKQFIADLMPKNPIYIDLLPEDAKQVIGQIHPETAPAVAMLQKEHFHNTHYVDIFDAGPVIEAQLSTIRIVQQSVVREVSAIKQDIKGDKLLLSRCHDFRAVMASAMIEDERAVIDADTARALDVVVGDDIRMVD